jgi:hypothetical protein
MNHVVHTEDGADYVCKALWDQRISGVRVHVPAAEFGYCNGESSLRLRDCAAEFDRIE